MVNNELDFVHIMDKLEAKAKEDGSVSESETRFLASLGSEVVKFENAMLGAKDDDFITDDEFHELVILRDAILNKAMDFTSDSDDVNHLVQELFEEINNHEIPGMIEDEKTDEQEERSENS